MIHSKSSLLIRCRRFLFNTNSPTRQVQHGFSASSQQFPRVIQTNGVPIHLYTNDIEPEAIEQLRILAESPLPVDYVAAMPDAHWGKGVTVGTVFASDTYVCPNAVGVDIGCGMAAIPVHGLYKDDLSHQNLVNIQRALKQRIPTGFHQHSKMLPGVKQTLEQMTEELLPTDFIKRQLSTKQDNKVTDQLGTLGGGNHFLEVVYEDQSKQVWLMLHSGSRNIGNRVATHYDQVAKQMLQKQGIDTRALRGINYMPIESQEGHDYLTDMEWCQKYAWHNRRYMKEIMIEIVERETGRQADLEHSVNIHHNYCACEDCGNGRKLWVTRKGATSAKKGELGIIPGSMKTGSYITRGKGDLNSWNSSSHGAGRRMSRTKAHSTISQQEFQDAMEGILCDTHPSVKDEAPQAYKDLTEVMKNQESLTDIVYRVLPIINVKGFEEKIPSKYRKNNQGKVRQNKKGKKK